MLFMLLNILPHFLLRNIFPYFPPLKPRCVLGSKKYGNTFWLNTEAEVRLQWILNYIPICIFKLFSKSVIPYIFCSSLDP